LLRSTTVMITTPNTTASDASEASYRESLAWLFGQTRGDAPRDVARMKRLIDALDLRTPPRIAQVVGTNGKGTVTSMTAAAATAAGVRSGCFTSPHVEDFRERIAVDGRLIGREEVVAFVDRVRSATLPLTPAFFEITLAMALDHFERSGVAFAAVEAGVGALHDATSALSDVAVAAITPIALDHLETLGPGLREIARDKAAAIRSGVPAAAAAQPPEVTEVLVRVARERGSELRIDSPDDALFTLPSALVEDGDPVRRRNQRLAAATVRLLRGVSETALAAGLAVAPLPGRGERFRVGTVEVLLDGAHDPAAAAALAERAGREYVLLFGSLRRKQGEATLAALEPRSTRVFVTGAGGEPSAVASAGNRTVVPDPAEALARAFAACPAGGLLVIGGSLYLAGELRPLLRSLAARDGS
jgi:dihydrofolate synthase/folylpolyglutamate synthase